ncbi:hypothetical protein IW261DRAFT_957527 [Armillaria novae-zelandiae]|uniref:AN1-type domain-containing protein n=1 Tax=Armillaria novae-zelandiae TaxID=153914 RepID=A0AA39PFW3_9AGAR|nr:hypothetical protein IW261DRAFT_957527 [Armillaria novae-zelandiae]
MQTIYAHCNGSESRMRCPNWKTTENRSSIALVGLLLNSHPFHVALTRPAHIIYKPFPQLPTHTIPHRRLPLFLFSPAHTKKRCQFQINTASQCNSAALRLVGECPHCLAQFCGAHRLPEHHSCNNLEDCRQQAFLKNKEKLESERTVASKMATA